MFDLDLDIWETTIYAIIYGFSQDGESTFKGSWTYLAKMVKCSRRKVSKTLPRLVALGLVEKIDTEIRGVRMCEYRAIIPGAPCAPVVHEIHRGSAHGAPNNNIYINNTLSINNKRSKFQKPSVFEVAEYCTARGNDIDAQQFVSFYESKGWLIGNAPMKDWKAAVRTWEGRSKCTPTPKPPPRQKKESTFERSVRAIDEMLGTDAHNKMFSEN